ncbi:hypothetical protein UCRPA7_2041 [Phaeoacremonium minimum UCRPA7]|uniref:Centromere protein H C-terminal domain-containing protein n=1 Tax=Phaeoacremonium minimum (strain UCR-PA7) TaxID=1286976 RepID=R8BT39_PHAM7|nr:hypothetical protein UCRPA7_2041 [Phaeoacremonium minimum UCRPA7]EOO02469.1 hypothetical protein UCRPA7_2041 [Phaeoacremonium minimum UCRPA7]
MPDAGATSAQEDGPLLLSNTEKRVLELYDQLRDLQLQIALMKAQQDYDEPQHEVSEDDVKQAQDELLESSANYNLRNGVLDSVMIANPILKAVHNSTHASPIDRDLLPLVEERDLASVSVAQLSTELRGVLDRITEVESESLRVSRKNVELASEVLRLAEEANREKEDAIEDQHAKAEIERLERELKVSRQRWKVMKGTASAVIAGSGVDWASDAELREMVLDPE